MDDPAPGQLLYQWLAAFNDADAAAISELYAEFATCHQPGHPPVVGRTAIHAMFARQFLAPVTIRTPDNVFEDGEWAILEWYDAAGIRGCAFFHILGSRIVFQRSYS